jgi:hypothetical protein
MKATNNTSTTKNTQKPSQDIRNNLLFTDITAQEEVFVRGGAVITIQTQRFRAPELL